MTKATTISARRLQRFSIWLGYLGFLVLCFWIVVAIAAPWLAPFDPDAQVLPFAEPGALAPNGARFWFGADALGRDVLSRTIFGARTVLIYAPIAAVLAYMVGLFGGLIAGYFRGWVDEVLSQTASLVMSFPVMIIYLLMLTVFGASTVNIMLAVVVGGAPAIMRLSRGLVIEQRERGYVAAARLRAEANWFVMIVEILPNIRRTLLVDLCLRLSYVIVTIGTLGFLGLGLPPPAADWGGMINESRNYAMVFPLLVLAPTISIITLVLGINLIADALDSKGSTL
jgi:peptide/nickel transport system permease protein